MSIFPPEQIRTVPGLSGHFFSSNAAKARGYDLMTFAFGAMLLFSVLMEADLALTLVMVAVYLFIQFYTLWWRFRLEKEM